MQYCHVMLLTVLHSFYRFTAGLQPNVLNASCMSISNDSSGNSRRGDDTDCTVLAL